MNKYIKEDFIASKTINEYAEKFGESYKTLTSNLKQLGLLQEWMDAWNDRNYNDLLNDNQAIKDINAMTYALSSVHSICRGTTYSYKAVAKYLKDIKYTADSSKDTSEGRAELREDLEEVLTKDIFDKRKIFYKAYQVRDKLNKDVFIDVKNDVEEVMLSHNVDEFNYKDVNIKFVSEPKLKSVSTTKLVKVLGKEKAKELFPELFDDVLTLKIDYSKLYK